MGHRSAEGSFGCAHWPHVVLRSSLVRVVLPQYHFKLQVVLTVAQQLKVESSLVPVGIIIGMGFVLNVGVLLAAVLLVVVVVEDFADQEK